MTSRPEPLHRLVYCSRNAIGGSRADVRREIDAILSVARAKNASLGVTGALIFNDGFFGQVLEGPLKAVEEVFEKIQIDERHCDVVVLDLKPVTQRGFPHWSMGYIGASQEGAKAFGSVSRQSGFDRSTLSGDALFEALQDLAQEQEYA